jgi:MFS family permease
MFAYGLLAVVLALYLRSLGLSNEAIGVLFTLTMAGDTLVSLFLTTRADRFGRKHTLWIGAGLMMASSAVFALTAQFWVLVVAATIGVLSPSGNEIGPFLPVEQAALSEELEPAKRVGIFAWYNLAGYVAAALGSACGGLIAETLQARGWAPLDSYRVIILIHGAIGLVMLGLYMFISARAETSHPKTGSGFLGLRESKTIVLKLSGLFAIDAFAGGFVMQSLIAYWFHLRWGASEFQLGMILLFGNLFAGASALMAARIANRFGLVNTMVWTHIPSNVLLILVPFMPSFGLAIAMLLLRFCLSQMDVPTRQAYVMSVVRPEERSAAGGVTNVARSVGVARSPLLLGFMMANPRLGLPLIVAGSLKIIYDLSLWTMCRKDARDLRLPA